jgi:hypothetical protein
MRVPLITQAIKDIQNKLIKQKLVTTIPEEIAINSGFKVKI